ncbi:hypothetical protein [Kribbella sp. C-35]|uniref:hypothetical protein n=1 Tax=Kribbella sp. C-35 TaxID=2789276 RepID=UPI00397BF0DE
MKTRFLNQVDEQRNPKTRATVNQLVTRYFEILDVATSTLNEYKSKYRVHAEPYIGRLPLTQLQDAEALDSLYAEMRRSAKHCRKRKEPGPCASSMERIETDPWSCVSWAGCPSP